MVGFVDTAVVSGSISTQTTAYLSQNKSKTVRSGVFGVKTVLNAGVIKVFLVPRRQTLLLVSPLSEIFGGTIRTFLLSASLILVSTVSSASKPLGVTLTFAVVARFGSVALVIQLLPSLRFSSRCARPRVTLRDAVTVCSSTPARADDFYVGARLPRKDVLSVGYQRRQKVLN